jgi:hypothetical protein
MRYPVSSSSSHEGRLCTVWQTRMNSIFKAIWLCIVKRGDLAGRIVYDAGLVWCCEMLFADKKSGQLQAPWHQFPSHLNSLDHITKPWRYTMKKCQNLNLRYIFIPCLNGSYAIGLPALRQDLSILRGNWTQRFVLDFAEIHGGYYIGSCTYNVRGGGQSKFFSSSKLNSTVKCLLNLICM